MRIVIGIVAAVCFVVSLLVHGLTFARVDVLESFPGVWSLHFGIFLVFIPYVIATRRTFGPKPSMRQLRSALPGWANALSLAVGAYALINFALFIFLSGGDTPEIRDGHFILQNHGKYIRQLTEHEYHLRRAYVIRGFSGHWLVFYAVPALYFLFCDQEKAQAHIEKQRIEK